VDSTTTMQKTDYRRYNFGIHPPKRTHEVTVMDKEGSGKNYSCSFSISCGLSVDSLYDIAKNFAKYHGPNIFKSTICWLETRQKRKSCSHTIRIKDLNDKRTKSISIVANNFSSKEVSDVFYDLFCGGGQ